MRALAKRRHANSNAEETAHVVAQEEEESTVRAATVAYVVGRCEAAIESCSRSTGIPYAQIADGVATVLFRQTYGQVLGFEYRVSGVQ